MGADLYIRSITDAARDKYDPKFTEAVQRRNAEQQKPVPDKAKVEKLQKEVSKYYDLMYPEEGYFRDSYNGTSLFWLLEKSYWTGLGPMLNKKGELSPTKAKKLLADLKAHPVPRVTEERLRKGHCKVDPPGGEDDVEAWQKYFDEKHARFCKFLETAIRLKEPIYCSI